MLESYDSKMNLLKKYHIRMVLNGATYYHDTKCYNFTKLYHKGIETEK